MASLVPTILLIFQLLPPGQEHSLSGPVFGTFFRLTWVSDSHQKSQVDQRLREVFDLVNNELSRYQTNSQIWHFNRLDANEKLKPSLHLEQLIELSREVWTKSNGAFDPTVGPLVALFGFNDQQSRKTYPTENEIQQAMAISGFDKLEYSSPFLSKKVKGLELDFSGIAKGYAVDLAARAMEEMGIHNFMVEIGGEIVTRGLSPHGKPWAIGIAHPSPGVSRPQKVLHFNDAALATSGDYQNFYILDGQLISHSIDPRTGHPLKHNLASVTVLADTCAKADAYATAILVMGPKEGFDFASREGIKAFLMIREGKKIITRPTPAFLAGVNFEPWSAAPLAPGPGFLKVLSLAFVLFFLAFLVLFLGRLLGNKKPLKRHCSAVMGELQPNLASPCSCCREHPESHSSVDSSPCPGQKQQEGACSTHHQHHGGPGGGIKDKA